MARELSFTRATAKHAVTRSALSDTFRALEERLGNGGDIAYTAGAPLELTGNAIGNEFFDFYRTPRVEVTPAAASPKTSTMPTIVAHVKFANFYPLENLDRVSPRPLLFITGDQAQSKEFSKLA